MMMKRYMMVFVALCLLLMTNVCFAELIAIDDIGEDIYGKIEIKSNPTNYGNRWKYLYTYRERGAFIGEYVNDYYFDRASAQYTILRGKRVLEFALWNNPCGDQQGTDYPLFHPCLVDLDDCVLYTTESFVGLGCLGQYSHFPPGEVVTSDSAVHYMIYDHNKEKYVFAYPGLTAQQAKDYHFLMSYEYHYVTYHLNKGELPDLAKGQATGVKYSPTTYEYLGLAGIGESALYPDTGLTWQTMGHDNCTKAMYSIILKLIPEALQIANQ